MIGGSSSINGLIYIRGHNKDFDHWRQLGNSGWSFEDVPPFFRKSENQERGSDEYHGVGGPLDVPDLRSPHELHLAGRRAVAFCGSSRPIPPSRRRSTRTTCPPKQTREP